MTMKCRLKLNQTNH